jgi:hypothetical protein
MGMPGAGTCWPAQRVFPGGSGQCSGIHGHALPVLNEAFRTMGTDGKGRQWNASGTARNGLCAGERHFRRPDIGKWQLPLSDARSALQRHSNFRHRHRAIGQMPVYDTAKFLQISRNPLISLKNFCHFLPLEWPEWRLIGVANPLKLHNEIFSLKHSGIRLCWRFGAPYRHVRDCRDPRKGTEPRTAYRPPLPPRDGHGNTGTRGRKGTCACS